MQDRKTYDEQFQIYKRNIPNFTQQIILEQLKLYATISSNEYEEEDEREAAYIKVNLLLEYLIQQPLDLNENPAKKQKI